MGVVIMIKVKILVVFINIIIGFFGVGKILVILYLLM